VGLKVFSALVSHKYVRGRNRTTVGLKAKVVALEQEVARVAIAPQWD